MESKKKKYEINSMVRVPDLDDINKAASDFNERQAADEQNRDFIARNAKHLISAEESSKYSPKLSNIKKEMQQLAMVVASTESEKKEVETETSVTAESADKAVSQDAAEVTSEAEAVLPDAPDSGT